MKITSDEMARKLAATTLARKVRNRLDAAGHSEIPFDDLWVRFSPVPRAEAELVVDVPVGASHLLPLMANHHRDHGDDDQRMIDGFADELACALPHVARGAPQITRYLERVRKAALREVEASRRVGADLQLVGVAPRPTLAYHMAKTRWQDAVAHVLARVSLRRLNHALRLEVDGFDVEEPEDVRQEVAGRRREQWERQLLRGDLRERGADCRIDGVTRRLLDQFDLPLEETLLRVQTGERIDLPVTYGDGTARLSVSATEGRVRSNLCGGSQRWSNDRLELSVAGLGDFERPRPGRPVGAAGGAIWRDLMVVAVEDLPDGGVAIDVETPRFLFDAVTGRLWNESESGPGGERRLAA